MIRPLMAAFFAYVLQIAPASAVIITVSNNVAPLPIDDNFSASSTGYVDVIMPIAGGWIGSNFFGLGQRRVFEDQGPRKSWWRDEVDSLPAALPGPLAIAATDLDELGHQNISVFDFSNLGIGRSVGGVTNADPDINLSTGQGGAIAIFFNRDRDLFGFDIIGRDVASSELILYFFGRDSSVISTPVVFPLAGLNPIWSPTLKVFLPGTGSVTVSADSPLIAGMLLTSNDPFGVGLVNLRVPVPATLWLLAIVVAAWSATRARIVSTQHRLR